MRLFLSDRQALRGQSPASPSRTPIQGNYPGKEAGGPAAQNTYTFCMFVASPCLRDQRCRAPPALLGNAPPDPAHSHHMECTYTKRLVHAEVTLTRTDATYIHTDVRSVPPSVISQRDYTGRAQKPLDFLCSVTWDEHETSHYKMQASTDALLLARRDWIIV